LEVTGFAERLLAVIDEGRRTATYKLALLLALIDCCITDSSETGAAPVVLTTRQIADRVAALYWPQVVRFPTDQGEIELRQITNKNSAILNGLIALREVTGPVRTWEAAKSIRPMEAVASLDVVELTVARYPLVHLQVIDGTPQPFIYELGWSGTATMTKLRQDSFGEVRLMPGAGDHLVRLAPLVRPLVRPLVVCGLQGAVDALQLLHELLPVPALAALAPTPVALRR